MERGERRTDLLRDRPKELTKTKGWCLCDGDRHEVKLDETKSGAPSTIRNNLLGTWRCVFKYLWEPDLPLFKGYGPDQTSTTRGGPILAKDLTGEQVP